MKVSLIFLLVALYGAVADDDTSSSEEQSDVNNNGASLAASATVSTSSSSSEDSANWGSKVQAAIDNMSDFTHGAVVDGSAKINSALHNALDRGVKISQQATQLHANIVDNVDSAAQAWVGKGIDHMSKLHDDLQSSPFGALLRPALAMKINGLKMGQKAISSMAALEKAKVGYMSDIAAFGANAGKGVAGISANLATTGSEFGNNVAKQASSIIGGKIDSLGRAASGISGSFLGAAGLSGDASTSNGLSGRFTSGSFFG